MSEEAEFKNYMKTEKKKTIDELSANIDKDKDAINERQRFGFFSIPYATHIGDRNYSKSKPSRINDDKKVITGPRGIFTMPGKKGQYNEAFFIDFVTQEKETLNRIKEMNENDKAEFIKKVNSRKKANRPTDIKPSFKPTSPHEYDDFFESNKPAYDQPITKFIDKKLKIDHEKKSVFTAKRGIYTNPPKEGNATTPGILFSILENDYKKSDYVKPVPEKRSRSADKGDERFAFKPASLAIDAPFDSDKVIYGENEKEINILVEKSLDIKKAGKEKFKKSLPKHAAEHMNKFKPNGFQKSGFDSLFNVVTGIPFNPYIPSKRKYARGEKPEFKQPYS